MSMIKPIAEWVASFDEKTRDTLDVNSQVAKLDTANTGVGFVFVMETVASRDISGEAVGSGEELNELESYAVMKIRGTWYVITDGNVSDIFTAVLRMASAELFTAGI